MVSKGKKEKNRPVYPFNAIVGQEIVKTVLILNAIDPSIGGALISGPKGSGKSLLVNSFSEILPLIETIADCPFNCNPNDPINLCSKCRDKLREDKSLPIERRPMRIIKVPLSVTEDMIVGSINLERAVTHGIRALQPGLLAEANQNILYIDEVNLLSDLITDNILDAAASGWNIVERESVSIQHPARFILVGTMNPEEGDLRPQILDRFGICAETTNIQNPEERKQVLERNEEFRKTPLQFIKKYSDNFNELKRRIEQAKNLLPEVEVPDELYSLVAETCSKLRVDGFRPDIVAAKVAKVLTAFKGKNTIEKEDILTSLELSLGHRTRSSGLLPPPKKKEIRRALRKAETRGKISIKLDISKLNRLLVLPKGIIDKFFRKNLKNLAIRALSIIAMIASMAYLLNLIRRGLTVKSTFFPYLIFGTTSSIMIAYIITKLLRKTRETKKVTLGLLDPRNIRIETSGKLPGPQAEGEKGGVGSMQGEVKYIGEDTSNLRYGPKILGTLESFQKRPQPGKLKISRRLSREGGHIGGRRTKVISSSSRGRYAWYQTPKERPKDIAIVPTIKVAALKQRKRRRRGLHTIIEPEDIREKVREYSAPYSIIMLVDMSLSMIESVDNLVETIYSLHQDVYRQRDKVGLIVFKGSKAYTLQHPTRNLDLVVQKLRNMGASDFTPMAAGLFETWKVLRQERIRNSDALLHLCIISDGITNVPLEKPLSPLTRRRYTSEAQADAFDIARLLVKEKIKVHIFNTIHLEEEAETFPTINGESRIRLTPTQFLMELARISKGKYKGLKLLSSKHR